MACLVNFILDSTELKRTHMRVWIFQTGEPLHCDSVSRRSMRAMNLANTLVERGHSVTLWSSNFSHQDKDFRFNDRTIIKINENLSIRLINSPGYARNLGFPRLVDHLILGVRLSHQLKNESQKPDIAFVGYPPIEFAFAAVKKMNSLNIPVIVDVKDQWPDVFVRWAPIKLQRLLKLLVRPYFYLGKKTLSNATALCSMSENFLDWAVKSAGRSKIELDFVAPLLPIMNVLHPRKVLLAKRWWANNGVVDDGGKKFLFVGTLSRAFNFEPIFWAAQKAHKLDLGWQFIICGEGENIEKLKNAASSLPNIVIPGWIDYPKIEVAAKFSTAGIAPYLSTADFKISTPNKINDYISFGLPVISSLEGITREMIQKQNVGLFYDSNSLNSLFNALMELEDPKLLAQLSEKAVKSYMREFEGKRAYTRLAKHLERMVGS